MKPKNFFKLHSYNIPVMGKTNAIIVSLQDVNYTMIPQFLCEIFTRFDNTDIQTIEKSYNDHSGTIKQYLCHLEKQGIGFFTNTPENFPKLSLDWGTPEKIKNAVIEIGSFKKFDYSKILYELNNLLCKHIEVWVIDKYSPDDVNNFLISTENSVLRSLSLFIPFQDNLEELRSVKKSFPKLTNIFLYNAPGRIKLRQEGIYGVKRNLSNDRAVFKDFKKDEFIIYVEFFMESINHNPYYNRKICIDREGNIKNCLTHKDNFGNIRDTSLEQVASDKRFQDLWYACNDKIEHVKDSEFRYIWFNTHKLEKLENGNYKIID